MLADDPEGKMLIFGISLPAIEKKKKRRNNLLPAWKNEH